MWLPPIPFWISITLVMFCFSYTFSKPYKNTCELIGTVLNWSVPKSNWQLCPLAYKEWALTFRNLPSLRGSMMGRLILNLSKNCNCGLDSEGNRGNMLPTAFHWVDVFLKTQGKQHFAALFKLALTLFKKPFFFFFCISTLEIKHCFQHPFIASFDIGVYHGVLGT